MKTILAAATALALFAPAATASWPGVADVFREYNDARRTLEEELTFAHAEITTDLQDVEVGGVVRIEGTARVDEGFAIAAIQFYVDRVPVASAPSGEQWSYDLDTRRLVDGIHEFSVSVIATPLADEVWVVGLSHSDWVTFRTLNHVVGVVLHEATYEGILEWTDVWTTTLDRSYVGLQMTITTELNQDGVTGASGPVVGQAVLVSREKGHVAPSKTWVATFGALQDGATVMSKPPHDLLKEGTTLTLAKSFVGDGKVTVRIEAIPWP